MQTMQKTPNVTYRFVVANSWHDDGSLKTMSEEDMRQKFIDSKDIYKITTRSGVSWAAMEAADLAYQDGWDSENEWPMVLLALDPLGEITRVDVEMEMQPEFTEARPTLLFGPNVDDLTLPMFPQSPEESKNEKPEVPSRTTDS